MNEFLQQNIVELVRLVTEMVSTGAQMASDQMPELLRQLVAYTLIDAKIGFYVSLVVCTISVVLGIASVTGMYNGSDAAVVGIILCPMILICSVVVGVYMLYHNDTVPADSDGSDSQSVEQVY